MTWTPSVENCDEYLGERTGWYGRRAIRYRPAVEWLLDQGLGNDQTVMDVGAGWTEFDITLREEYHWHGRYYPVDGGLDGTDLNEWWPSRKVEWIVALEIIEHLWNPRRFVNMMQLNATHGVVLSTPNPRTTDVFAMDHTHVSAISTEFLLRRGFYVEERSFYGQENDSLFATWRAAR